MSTHNIGFYEDLKKIIFELSSNIIKYAPYFFCCQDNFFCSSLYFLSLHTALCNNIIGSLIQGKVKSGRSDKHDTF